MIINDKKVMMMTYMTMLVIMGMVNGDSLMMVTIMTADDDSLCLMRILKSDISSFAYFP